MSSTINCTGNVASYKLVIANFSNSANQTTSSFGFPIGNGTKFRMYFSPKSTTPWDQNYASVYLNISSRNKSTLKVRHRMSIVNANGDKCNTQEGISMFKKNYFGAQYCIVRDVLMDSACGLLVSDTLTIVCEIEMVDDGEELQAKSSSDFSAISRHYKSLLNSAKHSDVVLSIGESEFRAHKATVSARSPVFAAMFDSDTKEALQGRVEIVDISIDVFELFLSYLYTDKIYSLDRFAPELLATADMYQMDCLKSLCEHFLCSNLTIDNVSELLIHADLYGAEALKVKCTDYITDNSEKVKATEGWKAVAARIDLLLVLFDRFSIKSSSVSK